MKANTKGVLLTKCDRILGRIDKFSEVFWNETNGKIKEADYRAFIKTMHIIVSSELNEKGVERV